ncbi:EthD domain-containing protein [Novosphingobium sp. HII-3]|uniref:EthD domain-containing protein n=1 Tax=Novosphingobium sp. HII-3 TaxID=2075565 RepID=UPI000CDA17E9|nr:EthD domain-containing protein [Novosphingobium sp. HII-3]
MIKIIFCLRRAAHMTQQEFQQYWHEKHAPLVREVAPILGIRRYVQSHAFQHPGLQPAIVARKGEVEPYDGVAELWYDSVEALLALGSDENVRRAGRTLLEDERKFIDLASSPLFYSIEREIIADSDRPDRSS